VQTYRTIGVSVLAWTAAAALALGSVTAEAQVRSGPRPRPAQPTPPPAAKPRPTPSELIGLTLLAARPGEQLPTGRGIAVGHVEGPPGSYIPDMADGRYDGLMVRGRSGPSVPSGHASATGALIYGPDGLAPGVTDIDFYASDHWLGEGYLRAASTLGPVEDDRRLFNHSWISEGHPRLMQVLRRVDYLADARDVVMVVGVNNGRESTVPVMLASAYNVISVGHWTGNSSGGFTGVDGVGRCKPEIVAPGGKTSFATAIVTASAARLLEMADRLPPESGASHSEVIKVVLMAGAVKPSNWQALPGKALDEHLGAGRLRVNRSYDVLVAGPVDPGQTGSLKGWDFASLEAESSAAYVIDSTEPIRQMSVMLVWHRRIDGRMTVNLATGQPAWNTHARLANLDLQVDRVGDAEQGDQTLAVCDGQIDNIEHAYLRELPAGQYRLSVRRTDELSDPWDYAIAWWAERLPKPRVAAPNESSRVSPVAR